MATHETTTYHCDKCDKKLKTSDNSLNIVSSLSESVCWSRLHVKIEHIHGMHNNATVDQADLCKPCAIALLTDALKRVRSGERATAGTEHAEEQSWK